MMDVDPHLLEAIVRVVRALESVHRRYCLIGALVPRILMDVPPAQRTRDVDVMVDVDSIRDVEQLMRELRSRGYSDVAPPMRFQDEMGVQIDVIPYSDALAPEGRLVLPGDIVLRVDGFANLLRHAVHVELVPGLNVAVAPLPLYAMLKLAAYADRGKMKDINGFLHCARYYADLDEGERRYGLEHSGALVPLEFGGAFLLGVDGQPYQDRRLRERLTFVLGRFDDGDASELGGAARDAGRLPTDERWRAESYQLIRWYRLGAQMWAPAGDSRGDGARPQRRKSRCRRARHRVPGHRRGARHLSAPTTPLRFSAMAGWRRPPGSNSQRRPVATQTAARVPTHARLSCAWRFRSAGRLAVSI